MDHARTRNIPVSVEGQAWTGALRGRTDPGLIIDAAGSHVTIVPRARAWPSCRVFPHALPIVPTTLAKMMDDTVSRVNKDWRTVLTRARYDRDGNLSPALDDKDYAVLAGLRAHLRFYR